MYLNEKKQILSLVWNLAITHLILRAVKFIIGIFVFISLFFMFFQGSTFGKIKKNAETGWIAAAILLVIWILLTITSRILLIVYIVKIGELTGTLGIRHNHLLLTKLSSIKTLSIIGCFISYVNITVANILSLRHNHKEELLNLDYQVLD